MNEKQFVSRAGLKLEHALNEFEFDVTGLVCADFGCNIGGFTDCLLQRGAKLVYAIDTGYGTLAWKLRSNDHVITMERTNALHAVPPASPDSAETHFQGVDLVTIDLAWTQQRHSIPAALKWLKKAVELEVPITVSFLERDVGLAKLTNHSDPKIQKALDGIKATIRKREQIWKK